MTPAEQIPFRRTRLWCLIIAGGLVSAYLGFISLVSVWVGVGHLDQPGSWVPILVGTSFFIVLVALFLRTFRRLRRRLRDREFLHVSSSHSLSSTRRI